MLVGWRKKISRQRRILLACSSPPVQNRRSYCLLICIEKVGNYNRLNQHNLKAFPVFARGGREVRAGCGWGAFIESLTPNRRSAGVAGSVRSSQLRIEGW